MRNTLRLTIAAALVLIAASPAAPIAHVVGGHAAARRREGHLALRGLRRRHPHRIAPTVRVVERGGRAPTPTCGAFVEVNGGSVTRINARRTSAYVGGFDPGTDHVIFQQVRGGESDLFLYDIGDRPSHPAARAQRRPLAMEPVDRHPPRHAVDRLRREPVRQRRGEVAPLPRQRTHRGAHPARLRPRTAADACSRARWPTRGSRGRWARTRPRGATTSAPASAPRCCRPTATSTGSRSRPTARPTSPRAATDADRRRPSTGSSPTARRSCIHEFRDRREGANLSVDFTGPHDRLYVDRRNCRTGLLRHPAVPAGRRDR